MTPAAVLERMRNRPILAAVLVAFVVTATLLALVFRPATPAPSAPITTVAPLAAAQVPATGGTSTVPGSGSAMEPGTVIEPALPSETSSDAVTPQTGEATDPAAEAVSDSSNVMVNPKSLPIEGGYTPPVAEQEPATMAQPVGTLYQRQTQGSSTTESFTSVTSLPSDPAVVGYIQATFPQEEWSRAERIAGCESGMRSVSSKANSNGSRDHGIFQLNDGGTLQNLLRATGEDTANIERALDPIWNVQAAHVLWQQRGWQPWACAARLGIVDGMWSSTPGPNW